MYVLINPKRREEKQWNIPSLDYIHIFSNPEFSDTSVFPNLEQQPSNCLIKACLKKRSYDKNQQLNSANCNHKSYINKMSTKHTNLCNHKRRVISTETTSIDLEARYKKLYKNTV